MICQTARLLVRRWTLDDAEAVHRIYAHPEVARFLRGAMAGESISAAREVLRRFIDEYEDHPGLGWWACVQKSSGLAVGNVTLQHLDGGPLIEVGWHFGRDAWGRGYATESALALIEHGFARLGLDRIVAVVRPENERSLRVCARVGLPPRGIERHYGRDLRFFSLSRKEWEGRRVGDRAT